MEKFYDTFKAKFKKYEGCIIDFDGISDLMKEVIEYLTLLTQYDPSKLDGIYALDTTKVKNTKVYISVLSTYFDRLIELHNCVPVQSFPHVSAQGSQSALL